MGRDSRAALVPHYDLNACHFMEPVAEKRAFFRPFAHSVVHILGKSHYDKLRLLLFCKVSGFFKAAVKILFKNDCKRRCQKFAFVADCNPCSAVPEIHGHYFHRYIPFDIIFYTILTLQE